MDKSARKISSLQEFPKDILTDSRVKDIGLLKCIQCGRCSASCPAAYISEDFSPRSLMRLLNMMPLDELLKEELIWKCGQCFTCHSRCPRNNSPATIIQVMRELAFSRNFHRGKAETMMASIGSNLFERGESVSPSLITQDFLSGLAEEVQELWRRMPGLRKELGFDEKDARVEPVSERAKLELRLLFEATGFTKTGVKQEARH